MANLREKWRDDCVIPRQGMTLLDDLEFELYHVRRCIAGLFHEQDQVCKETKAGIPPGMYVRDEALLEAFRARQRGLRIALAALYQAGES